MRPRFFKTIDSLRTWFATHGASKTELWIGYYKKSSGKGGVDYKQALDEALCVGWIDGVVKSIDDERYMQRWTPRKPTSIWSNVNVRKVEALMAAGRMTPAGLAAFARRVPERTGVYTFEKAPAEFAFAFLKRFKAEKGAWKFWGAQPPGYRRTVTGYVMSAKREETRERRFAHVLAHCVREARIPEYLSTPKAKKPPATKR